jgi:transcriptional regulator with XRE-family HTH domain
MNRGRYRLTDEDEALLNSRLVRDTTALRTLLERAITQVGSPANLARRMEITPSHISRLYKGTASLSIETMLRLADVLDEDGVEVLRTCGHARVAERIDLLRRGSPQRARSQLYDAIDRLSESDRQMVTSFVHRLLTDSPRPPKLPTPDPQTRSWR